MIRDTTKEELFDVLKIKSEQHYPLCGQMVEAHPATTAPLPRQVLLFLFLFFALHMQACMCRLNMCDVCT